LPGRGPDPCVPWECLLGLLGAVLGAALAPFLHADGVQRAANDVVAHPGQVLDAATANQDHRVLLQIVPDARNVGVDLVAIGQAHPCDLAQCRVGLLGRGGFDLRAYAALLRRALQGRRAYLVALLDARLADELVDGRHVVSIGTASLAGRCPSPPQLAMPVEKTRPGAFPPSRPNPPQRAGTVCSNKPPKGGVALGVNITI